MDLYTLVTDIGKAKIANAAVLGKKVDFSKLKVGDGNGNYYDPSESQTDLVHTVWQGTVNNVLNGGEKNPNWIIVQTVIPPGEGGFYIRECGLFDEEDNLLAISKYPESYKPTMDEGSTDDLTIELIFEVSNAATINLKIDPLVTLASLQNLYDLESKINRKIEALATQLNTVNNDLQKKINSNSCINENLLLNSDFMHSSNISNWIKTFYPVDLTITKNGIVINSSGNNGTTCVAGITQIFDTKLEDGTYTISICVNNQTFTGTGSIKGNTYINIINNSLVNIYINNTQIDIYNSNYDKNVTEKNRVYSNITIEYIKLEKGNLATPFVKK